MPTLAMIVEANPSLARVVAQAQRAARGPGPILIEGAPGTGKATLARAIHAQRTERARPFVALEGPRLSGEALRSARRRAGTGTLFIADAGCLPAETQAALLAFAEEAARRRDTTKGPLVIAATAESLVDLIRAGRFREDLYYRLATSPLTLPPLARRREDIAPLARSILERLCREAGRPAPMLSPDALARLADVPLPGNIDDLAAMLQGALARLAGSVIDAINLPPFGDGGPAPGRASGQTSAGELIALPSADLFRPAGDTPARSDSRLRLTDEAGEVLPLADIEAVAIRFALHRYGGQMSEVSRRLGIGRSTLYRKLKEFGLDGGNAQADGP